MGSMSWEIRATMGTEEELRVTGSGGGSITEQLVYAMASGLSDLGLPVTVMIHTTHTETRRL